MEREELFTEFFNRKLKERGYSLPQLADVSGITIKYLEQFAHGRFENLPSAPYLHGYFVRLGGILGFDPEEWWERAKREGNVASSGKTDKLARNRFARKRYRAIALAVIIVILIVAFFGLRASKILGEPKMEIAAPPSTLSRVTEDRVTVEGSVKNADEVRVNGAPVEINNDGFRTEVFLQPGMNTIEIKALKILGRETVITRQVYYDASQAFFPSLETQ